MDTKLKTPKIGLALGSGAARGWAHIGVLRALQAKGICIDVIAGCSIGALIGAIYSGGGLDAFETWLRGLTWRQLTKLIDFKISGGGLIRGEKILNYFNQNSHYKILEELPIPFAAVATNLSNGEEVWLKTGSIVNALRASMAMPGFISACHYQQQWLVDGGLVNPVPVSLCRSLGADIIIAVDLNHDLMQTPDQTESTALAPGYFEVLNNTLKIMQVHITRHRAKQEPADILIEPRLGHLPMFDFQHAAETIAEGYQATERAFAAHTAQIDGKLFAKSTDGLL